MMTGFAYLGTAMLVVAVILVATLAKDSISASRRQ